jgi:hypothetical protein
MMLALQKIMVTTCGRWLKSAIKLALKDDCAEYTKACPEDIRLSSVEALVEGPDKSEFILLPVPLCLRYQVHCPKKSAAIPDHTYPKSPSKSTKI